MVNKKTNKDYCRAYCQKKGDLYKANDTARKKNSKRKKKRSRAKKVRSVQEGRSCPYQGISFKKRHVRAITGQYCNVNLRNNTNRAFSIFNKINFELKCLQDRKITPIRSEKEGRGDWNSCQKIQSTYSCT